MLVAGDAVHDRPGDCDRTGDTGDLDSGTHGFTHMNRGGMICFEPAAIRPATGQIGGAPAPK